MKRRWRALVVGLLVVGSLAPATLVAPAPVRAVGLAFIDQHSESVPWEWLLQGDYAQTFTVGSTGTMTAVALWVFASDHATVEVGIHPLNASGFPTGFPLGTGYAAATSNDGFLTFPLAHFAVTAGQHLAIVFHVLSKCAIRGDTANPYARGMAQEYQSGWRGFQFVTTTDWAFRTYVTVSMVVPIATASAMPSLPAPAVTPTPHATAAPTLPPVPADASIAPSEIAQVATGSPAEMESGAAPAASGSGPPTAGAPAPGGSPDASGTPTRDGSPASGGANDLPLLPILAGVAVAATVLGGLFFLLVRRRRRART